MFYRTEVSEKNSNSIIIKYYHKKSSSLIILSMLFPLISSSSSLALIGENKDPTYDTLPMAPSKVRVFSTEMGDIDIVSKLKESHPTFIGSIHQDYRIPQDQLEKIRHSRLVDFHAKDKARDAALAVNTYDIDIYAASFSVPTEDKPTPQNTDDYFDIIVEFKATPSSKLAENFFLPSDYHLHISPVTLAYNDKRELISTYTLQNPSLLKAWEWCPQNITKGKTGYTDSMQFTIGGNIGGGFPQAVSASIAPGVTIAHQYTRDIMDLKVVSTMDENKARWDINYNRLSLKEKNGYFPKGTLKQSLRWVWKVNHQEALNNNLYQQYTLEGKSATDYLPLHLDLFAGFAHMHQTGRKLEHEKTPLLKVVGEHILVKVPPRPAPDKGKGTIYKTKRTEHSFIRDEPRRTGLLKWFKMK